MTVIKKTYYHACGGKRLLILKGGLTKGAMPLLWFNQGAWGIVSAEKIANIIADIKDYENLPTLDKKVAVGKLHWDEVKIIPPKIAKLLFDDQH